MRTSIENFTASPSQANFDACKTAWLASRLPYGQTEALRFYGGPIDDADGPEGLINSWPLDEVYIDYVQGNPDGGIINRPDLYPTLDKALIESLNQTGGSTAEQSEVNVATGYHAIEFLLWGQDLSTSGPGARQFTDYSTAAHADRRREYLKIAAELLTEHLKSVLDEWAPNGAYRAAFLAEPDPGITMGYIFTGLGELSKGELSGERMFVAVDSKDQENEHSCFSDNTHNDIKMNFLGIKNLYYGSYVRVDGTALDGPSLSGLAADIASDAKVTAVNSAFTEAEATIDLIPVPFDQAILNQPQTVLTASQHLSALSDRLVDVGLDLGAKY